MNSEFSQMSVCIQKIKTIRHPIPKKLLICCPGYLGHIEGHLTKTGKVFETFDESLPTCQDNKSVIF